MRFPRKLLHPVLGSPLILWTADRLRAEAPHLPLYFAVDGPDLADTLAAAGFSTIMTDPELPSGTDRVAAANETIGADLVLNVQADEPLTTREQLIALQTLVMEYDYKMGTIARRFKQPEDFHDPNKVKVVCDNDGSALYFSRSPIPYARDHAGQPDCVWLNTNIALWHQGLYAYRAEFLRELVQLPQGRLEQIEKLEQLRVMECGYKIGVAQVEAETIGVDAPEDIPALEAILNETHG